jgi:hypothetical protein
MVAVPRYLLIRREQWERKLVLTLMSMSTKSDGMCVQLNFIPVRTVVGVHVQISYGNCLYIPVVLTRAPHGRLPGSEPATKFSKTVGSRIRLLTNDTPATPN